MTFEDDIAIIVPCYNEEKRLDSAQFIDFADKNRHVTFIFVDDGSTDNTFCITEKMSLKSERIRSFRLDKNSGKAEAVRQGFLEAFRSRFGYIGFWDADLSTPLADIHSFYEIITAKEVCIVMGARVRLLGRDIRRKWARHYAGRLFATFASITLNLGVYDTQCGAKLFKNNELLIKSFSFPFSVGWVFDVELLARYKILAEAKNLVLENLIIEYPLEKWIHKKGSNVTPLDFMNAIRELFRIYRYLQMPYFRSRYEKKLKTGIDL